MTENNHNAFDRKVRSLLEQAQVPVPEGSWEALSGRLPKAPSHRAAAWRWAGVSVAAAAGLALALVLGGTFRSPQGASQDAPLLADGVRSEIPVQESQFPAPQQEEAPAVPDETLVRSARTARTPKAESASQAESASEAAPKAAAGAAEAAKAPSEETAAAPEEAAPSQGIASASTKSPSTGGSTTVTAPRQEPWSDPFARMAYEERHRSSTPRPSIQIHGLVGTNDKPMAALRGGMMAAPAKIISGGSSDGPATYIKETGESAYAIPVSFGVGAKFYFADRWAVGTGLDYSLLSRSFPGIYFKDGEPFNGKGDIRHSVQYLGIPVNLYFDILQGRSMHMYAFTGASVEKGIAQKYYIPAADGPQTWKLSVPGVQGSAALGVGVQLRLTDRLGLYLDPSAKYYFGKDQPKSIRTQQNFMFNLDVGLRFGL